MKLRKTLNMQNETIMDIIQYLGSAAKSCKTSHKNMNIKIPIQPRFFYKNFKQPRLYFNTVIQQVIYFKYRMHLGDSTNK